MKTFHELISWELEQEKKSRNSLHLTTEDATGKLGSCVLRKLRHLSNATGQAEKTGSPYLKATV